MRILHYHRNLRLEYGGVVRFALDLCAAVAARGHEVTLASPDLADVPEGWSGGGAGGLRGLRLPEPRGPLDLWGPGATREVRRVASEADVLHLHGAWMPTNVQIARVAERVGTPYVISPHGMFDDWSMAQKAAKKRVFYALAGRRLFRRAAVVHCTAQAELDQSRRWFPGARAVVVPPVLDLELFQALPGDGAARVAFSVPLAGAPVALFLSRVHPKKRPEVLIDAVALLKERGVACNLFIAGTGEDDYLAALKERAAHRQVADRTRFLGMVTGRLKLSLYQMADVFALPTSQENFGLVLPEAMACGAPAVTTKGVDIWPELEASGGAILAEATPAAFADVLGRLFGDPSLRARLSAAARAWVLEYLEAGAVAARYESLYESIRTRRPAALRESPEGNMLPAPSKMER